MSTVRPTARRLSACDDRIGLPHDNARTIAAVYGSDGAAIIGAPEAGRQVRRERREPAPLKYMR
jgi:hypothetical protein